MELAHQVARNALGHCGGERAKRRAVRTREQGQDTHTRSGDAGVVALVKGTKRGERQNQGSFFPTDDGALTLSLGETSG